MSQELQNYLDLMEKKHSKLQADYEVVVDDLAWLIETILELFPAGATSTRAISIKRQLIERYPLFLEKISPMYLAVIKEEVQHFDKKKSRRK